MSRSINILKPHMVFICKTDIFSDFTRKRSFFCRKWFVCVCVWWGVGEGMGLLSQNFLMTLTWPCPTVPSTKLHNYLLTCVLIYLLAYLLTCLLACFLPSFLTYLLTYLPTYLLTYLLNWLLTYLDTY